MIGLGPRLEVPVVEPAVEQPVGEAGAVEEEAAFAEPEPAPVDQPSTPVTPTPDDEPEAREMAAEG